MSKPESTPATALRAQMEKHRHLLGEAMKELEAAMNHDIPLLGKSKRAGVLVAGLLENYYTCAESIFIRVSQFFENNLAANRWHRDLLERMTLEIEAIRPRVISEASFQELLELMRFRHFKRYYFGAAYDWNRLEALVQRLQRIHGPLNSELQTFEHFLRNLAG